jgi:hypothetical protein
MEIRDEDLASTVLELEQRMPRRDIAAALGVDEDEVEKIASGYLPGPGVADRLRRLATGAAGPPPAARKAARISGMVLAAFALTDLVFFALVAAFVFLR